MVYKYWFRVWLFVYVNALNCRARYRINLQRDHQKDAFENILIPIPKQQAP